jgi:hypothetical protein
MIPLYEAVLTVTLIFPLPPAGISLSERRAPVQPQLGTIFSIVRTAFPVFVNVKI